MDLGNFLPNNNSGTQSSSTLRHCNLKHIASNVTLKQGKGEDNCTGDFMARLGSATYHPWVRTQLYNLNLNARENEKYSLPMSPGKGNGISKH